MHEIAALRFAACASVFIVFLLRLVPAVHQQTATVALAADQQTSSGKMIRQ
jgi:hypothetical protein